MRNVRFLLLISLLLAGYSSTGQQNEIVQNYISTYKDIAIAEMQRTGVPASVKLAQGIHETMAGTSDLVVKSNNHFGIKCKANWTGESVSHDDDLRGECFRKYNSPADSYRDHSNFLKNSQRYASLFKLDPLDYRSWAYGLKKAGYATNPKYPIIIIKLIEDYNLQNYTLVALGKITAGEEVLVSDNKADDKEEETLSKAADPENEVSSAIAATDNENADYPAGEFKINETRVIYAKKGTALLSIAQQYNISLARIFEFNDMKETESLARGQLLYLQRKRKTGSNEFHVVKTGETLYDISQEEAIRMDALLEYNHLQGYMLPAVGQRLYLRSKAPVRPDIVIGDAAMQKVTALAKNENQGPQYNAVQLANKAETYFTHVVRVKETVYSISRKYNVRIADIADWNQLSSYELKQGQQLKIFK